MPSLSGSVPDTLKWPREVDAAALFMAESNELQKCFLTLGTREFQTYVATKRVSTRLGFFPVSARKTDFLFWGCLFVCLSVLFP